MSELTAVVADIQRSSLHDGPGFRTTVFFKGCPLSCEWCHNPECISPEPQLMYYPERCIGCGQCESGCYSGARVLCGRKMTAGQIMDEIRQDRDYYGKTGGVTFSGGEPLMQREMVAELIKRCRDEGISTAAETSLIIFDREIFASLDYIMADFKISDTQKHKKYTGVGNETIRQNFLLLDALDKPFLVRTPVIPGINGNKEDIISIRDFLRTLKNVCGYELLAYHPLGLQKRKALGAEKTEFEIPSKELMEELRSYADLSGKN